MRSFETIFVSLSLSLLAFAAHGVNHARHHANRALVPRDQFNGIRMTWYDITTGETACGGFYQPSDYVVAISHLNYGSGALCGRQITIDYQGKSASATIVDECMGCPEDGLDLTEDLFSFLAGSLGAGVISGDWGFGGGGAAPAAKAPTTSSTPEPAPATHYKPPPTTSTTTSSPPPPPPTSTTSKTTSSSSPPPSTSHSSSTTSTTQTSSSAGLKNAAGSSSVPQPSGTATAGQTDTIVSMYQVIIGFGSIVLASKQ